MKTLNKLNLKHEKLMKNEDLVTLRGGYDGGQYIKCQRPYPMGGDCYIVGCCLTAPLWCDLYCPGWEGSICV